jgi:hypothetical protein
MTATRTPCSIPPCDDGPGEPCDRHETEAAHAEGDHEFCGLECEVTMPSEQMRNAILCRAIPGSPRMLAELERRAAVSAANQVRTDADLRATEGETELAEYGRELAELITPKEGL